MTALVVARFDLKDAEKMDAYATAAGPAVLAYGGEFVAIGEKVTALVGENAMQSIAIVRFPDVASAKTWFASRNTPPASRYAKKPRRCNSPSTKQSNHTRQM